VSEPSYRENDGLTPLREGLRIVHRAAVAFGACVLLANAYLIAYYSRGVGGTVVFVNLGFVFLGSVSARVLERKSGGAPLTAFAIAVFFVPFLAVVVGECIIAALELDGC
jgi:hypothetical protein